MENNLSYSPFPKNKKTSNILMGISLSISIYENKNIEKYDKKESYNIFKNK